MDVLKQIDWLAWLFTLLLIIGFREAAVWVTTQFNHPEMGNLVGLLSLLIVLILWRRFGNIPLRLIEVNGKIMKESAFAFLPISAGSLIMLTQLGSKTVSFLIVLCVSTLLPLWLYAKIAKRWL